MPRILSNPPDEFAIVAKFLDEIEQEMRKIEKAPITSPGQSDYWPIFKLHHQRSRYIFSLYKSKQITKSLYKYLRENNFVDHALVCYWRRNGYENLCCLRCVQPMDSKYGKVCVCRVPQRNISLDETVECDFCGCNGCSGY